MSHHDHISHHDTKNDRLYYIPALFRHNEYFNGTKIVHILILDLVKNLLRSREICSAYYGYYGSNSLDVLFINNHPVSKFIVSGKIVSVKWKTIEGAEYLNLRIDDSSNYFAFLEEQGGIDLVFKCDKDLLLSSGLTIYDSGSLVGLNINVLCSITSLFPPDMCPFEISVDFVNEVRFGWSDEIQFWKAALADVKHLTENKWVISNQLLAQYFSSLEVDDDTGAVLSRVGSPHHGTYIQQLQLEAERNDLVITSPYSTFSTQGLNSFIDEFELDEDTSSDIHETGYRKFKGAIPIIGRKKATTQLMECLIRLTTSSTDLITTSSFYNFPNVQILLDMISSLSFQEQGLGSLPIRDYEDIRRSEFTELMKNFLRLNLVTVRDNGSIMDVSILRKLSLYAKKRLLVLIKLRCLTSIIDIPHILRRLQLYERNISLKTVIDVFKVTLRLLISGDDRDVGEPLKKVVKNWWFEIKSSSMYCVHFEYLTK